MPATSATLQPRSFNTRDASSTGSPSRIVQLAPPWALPARPFQIHPSHRKPTLTHPKSQLPTAVCDATVCDLDPFNPKNYNKTGERPTSHPRRPRPKRHPKNDLGEAKREWSDKTQARSTDSVQHESQTYAPVSPRLHPCRPSVDLPCFVSPFTTMMSDVIETHIK